MIFLILLSGCTIGRTVKGDFFGRYYLETGEYGRGEDLFRRTVLADPDDVKANFYLGRFLLAEKKVKEALAYLKKAVLSESDNPDYHFWYGLAWGESGNLKRERESYLRALQYDRKHLQALLYLGHNLFRDGQYDGALQRYQETLAIWPECRTALYNRALIARILKRTAEEKNGWLAYLKVYPSGSLAIRAADYLNELGDFSFQNHMLGARMITLGEIVFNVSGSTLDSRSLPSLDVTGATAAGMMDGKLQVIVYQKNNKKLAKARALAVRSYLYEKYPELKKRGVGVSWFGIDRVIKIGGRTIRNHGAVRFLLADGKRILRAKDRKRRVPKNKL
ncbi:tetratricopeptide repeat protein [Desulfomarina sp.]